MSENLNIEKNYNLVAPTDRSLDKYVDILEIPKGELEYSVILNLGSGAYQQFSRDVKNRVYSSRVISIDPSLGLSRKQDVLNFHQHYSARERRKDAQPLTLIADSQALPLEDESVNRLYALYSVPQYVYEAETKQSLLEMTRVLKTNGIARVYPVFENQINDVQDALGGIPGIGIELKQKRNDDAYLLIIKKATAITQN